MRKSDLKTGWKLIRGSGEELRVIDDKYIRSASSFTLDRNYNNDLEFIGGLDRHKGKDIVKVYKPITAGKTFSNNPDDFRLIWERKDDPEIEITVKINGKASKLSDLSEETLLAIRGSQ